MAKQSDTNGRGPLAGISVVDISQGWAAPGGTMLLADQGADVIKVEPLEGDQARNYFCDEPINGEERGFLAINRSKRGIALNLKSSRGREILLQLVATADVFVHNFRPGVVERLGLDYPTLSALYPRLIYVSLTAAGDRGPYARQRAYDVVLQSLGGVMRFAGPDEHPAVSGIWVSDCSTMIMLAYAVTLALFARERYGYAQSVETNLFAQTLFMQLPDLVAGTAESGATPKTSFREELWSFLSPCRCQDGRYIVAVAMTNQQWHSLCTILGVPHLKDDPALSSPLDRFRRGSFVHDQLERAFSTRALDEWLDRLASADVPCSPVLRRDEVLVHPQVTENDMVIDIDHPTAGLVRMLNVPFRLGRDQGGIQRPSPLLGEHTREVLLALGCTESELQALADEDVLRLG